VIRRMPPKEVLGARNLYSNRESCLAFHDSAEPNICRGRNETTPVIDCEIAESLSERLQVHRMVSKLPGYEQPAPYRQTGSFVEPGRNVRIADDWTVTDDKGVSRYLSSCGRVNEVNECIGPAGNNLELLSIESMTLQAESFVLGGTTALMKARSGVTWGVVGW
jgi:hypothetical protein